MKKNRFVITKSNDRIHFYLICELGRVYLFSEAFHKAVFDYCRKGRAENELYRFKQYDRNPRLAHTIARCLNPTFRKYAMEEYSVMKSDRIFA